MKWFFDYFQQVTVSENGYRSTYYFGFTTESNRKMKFAEHGIAQWMLPFLSVIIMCQKEKGGTETDETR